LVFVFILFLALACACACVGSLPESSPAGRWDGFNAGDVAPGTSALPGARRGRIFSKKVIDSTE